MQDRLVRVETKLDLLIDGLVPRQADHEVRLRAVELAVAQLKIRAAIVASGSGAAGGVFTALLAHFTIS